MNKASLLQLLANASAGMSGKDAGSAKEAAVEGEKNLELQWSTPTAYCGDEVQLLGLASGFARPRQALLQLRENERLLAQMEAEGEHQLLFHWQVVDLPFSQDRKEHAVAATCAAAGLKKQAAQPLQVIPLPDAEAQPVVLRCASDTFAWQSTPHVAIQGQEIQVRLAFRTVLGWSAHWIAWDPKADSRTGWAWVRDSGEGVQYWNTQQNPHGWAALPRPVEQYQINHTVLVEKDGRFVSRDNEQWIWPQALASNGLEQQAMQRWQQAVTAVWDKRFRLKRNHCHSTDPDCCAWMLRVQLAFDDHEDNPVLYLVDGFAPERFSLKDWYLRSDNPRLAAHQVGHWLGAYDEFELGVLHPSNKNLEEQSIMGILLGKPHAHQLDALVETVTLHINKLVNRAWSFTLESLT